MHYLITYSLEGFHHQMVVEADDQTEAIKTAHQKLTQDGIPPDMPECEIIQAQEL